MLQLKKIGHGYDVNSVNPLYCVLIMLADILKR